MTAPRRCPSEAAACAACLILLIAFGCVLGLTAPARADDIAATGRGVVRVVTIAVVDGQVVGFGHGSGVAVAPDRIVTNAHVVELAERYPDNVVVGVVPSEGDKSYQGRVVAYDAQARSGADRVHRREPAPADALHRAGRRGRCGGRARLSGQRRSRDRAIGRRLHPPTSPVRSEGVLSGRRSLTGVEVLLHTASIARGNSGGPLLDRCGRVIGINSAITRGEEGDELVRLRDRRYRARRASCASADQRYASVGTPCTSIEERLRDDSAADARARRRRADQPARDAADPRARGARRRCRARATPRRPGART